MVFLTKSFLMMNDHVWKWEREAVKKNAHETCFMVKATEVYNPKWGLSFLYLLLFWSERRRSSSPETY
jgi:hypothetical protein